jgi:hypothetical protein
VPWELGKGDSVVVVVVVVVVVAFCKSLAKLCYLIVDSLSSCKKYLLQPFQSCLAIYKAIYLLFL